MSRLKFSCYLCGTTEGAQNSGWMRGGGRPRASKAQDILEREGLESSISPGTLGIVLFCVKNLDPSFTTLHASIETIKEELNNPHVLHLSLMMKATKQYR